ncbi:hypothetical protein D3C86_1620290 [compost metagenome]
MDAVVVPRAQVDGREVAVVELGSELGIAAHQRLGRIMVALGLKDLVTGNGAQLAHGTVYRAHPGRLGQRARIGTQAAREERVERVIAGRIRILGLGHVDVVMRDEAFDHPGGQPARPGACQTAHEGGERLLGQQILGKHGKAIRHWFPGGSEGNAF